MSSTPAPSVSSHSATRAIAFGVFFVSGAAGLIYQVVWSRMLTLVIGVSIFAITAVICTFMAGLAVGSYLVGLYGDRWRSPLRIYGVMEGVIGIYAIATPSIFDAIQPLYVAAFQNYEGPALNAFRILLSAGVLLLPTALMGGTLPLLSRVVTGWQAARDVGLLYSVNTFGAVVGCVSAAFLFLPLLGGSGSLVVAALLNLGVAAVAFLAPRGPGVAPAPRTPTSSAPAHGADRFVLALFFVSGFAALGYEVLWTRALLVYLRSSTYAFAVMLAIYLLGVAFGSVLASRWAGNSRQPLVGLAFCQIGVVASVTFALLAFGSLDSIGFALVGSDRIDGFGRAIALMFAQASVILLLPTLFMGAMFPFGVAAVHRASRDVGRSVGSLYAVNTFGNIAGSILVGFVAIPVLGVRHSLLAMIVLNLIVAAAALGHSGPRRSFRFALTLAAVGTIVAIHLLVPPQIFYQSHHRLPGTRLLLYREGASDTVAVVENRRGDRTLIYGDGRGAAGTGSLRWNLYFGHLPMLLHPEPERVLHICFGSGNSIMAVARHDPARVDAVELSPHVREAASFFWTNESVLDDPAVNLIIEDGRNFLLATERKYDVISLEPPNIFSSGVINLYTREFYESARDHLEPGGIMVQWLPSATLSNDDRGRLMRAFADAFPRVYVFQQLESPQLLLVGTLEPLSIDVDELAKRFGTSRMARDRENMKVRSAEELLAYFRLGDASFREMVSGYDAVRDDHTVVDFSIPRYIGSGFGFYLFTYPLGDSGFDVRSVARARTSEYFGWLDPVDLIIPDPDQAARVEEIRSARWRVPAAR